MRKGVAMKGVINVTSRRMILHYLIHNAAITITYLLLY